jgi:hypothetical protein
LLHTHATCLPGLLTLNTALFHEAAITCHLLLLCSTRCNCALFVPQFEWYDTMTSTILDNVTFENYRYFSYPVEPDNWWYRHTPLAFRMLSHSDTFKPGGCVAGACMLTCWDNESNRKNKDRGYFDMLCNNVMQWYATVICNVMQQCCMRQCLAVGQAVQS